MRPPERFTRRATLAIGLSLLMTPSAASTQAEIQSELEDVFKQANVQGTFVLLDVQAGKLTLVDADRAAKRFVTASTFKIANSLIALETSVIANENEIIPYGGNPQPFKAWEKDMGLREAIAVSNVPVYQELARRIGPKRYNEWLKRLDYGNKQTGTIVDRFWLDGPLEITAIEQARFVAKLAQGTLDISKRAQMIVREILRQDSSPGTQLFAKTGWLTSATPQIGWWTGWIEREGKIYAFALNMDMQSAADAPKRIELGKQLLSKLRLW